MIRTVGFAVAFALVVVSFPAHAAFEEEVAPRAYRLTLDGFEEIAAGTSLDSETWCGGRAPLETYCTLGAQADVLPQGIVYFYPNSHFTMEYRMYSATSIVVFHATYLDGEFIESDATVIGAVPSGLFWLECFIYEPYHVGPYPVPPPTVENGQTGGLGHWGCGLD